jgi:hypothetical protein
MTETREQRLERLLRWADQHLTLCRACDTTDDEPHAADCPGVAWAWEVREVLGPFVPPID